MTQELPITPERAALSEGLGVGSEARWRYYYRATKCKAKDAYAPDCVCWHDEGGGPFETARHDDADPFLQWREAPIDMSTMRCDIRTMVGENCITMDDGQIVYDLIHPKLLQQEAVELDFTGVQVFASSFFNIAIGRLLSDLDPETLNRFLKFRNLSPVGKDTLKRSVENAKQYYSRQQAKQRRLI